MNCPSLRRASFASCVFLLLAACGGGGGGGDQVAPAAGAPSATVTSPSISGTTDESEVTLRGTASSGTGTIQSITVNGKSASTTDGFANWSVTLPLVAGPNSFAVELIDGANQKTAVPFAVTLRRISRILVEPRTLILDLANARALVADDARRELIAVDLVSGATKLISGPSQGSGPLFESPSDLILDSANKRVLVLDRLFASIFEVDLNSGDRRVLVATSTANTPSLVSATQFVQGATLDELLVVSSSFGLVRVELSTGKLIVISDAEPALGPPLSTPLGLAYDAVDDRAYIVDAGNKDVFSVDVSTGKRFLLSENGVAPGPGFNFPVACALDPTHGLVVLDQGGQIVRVNLGTGARSAVPNVLPGTLLDFGTPTDIVTDNGFAYVTDRKKNLVNRVALTGSGRSALGLTLVGIGPLLEDVPDLSLSSSGRVVTPISSFGGGELTNVELETGSRQVISGESVGSGSPFSGFRSVDVNRSSDELVVTDLNGDVFKVNPNDGQRLLTASESSPGIGRVAGAAWLPDSLVQLLLLDDQSDSILRYDTITGAVATLASDFNGVSDMDVDHLGNRVVVIGIEEVYVLDLNTGTKTLVSSRDDSVGGGEPINTLDRVVVDGVLGVAYVRDGELDKLVAVDLGTGQRSLVCGDLKGSGLELSGSGGLALSKDRKTLFAYDSLSSAILAVGIATGDRVIISR